MKLYTFFDEKGSIIIEMEGMSKQEAVEAVTEYYNDLGYVEGIPVTMKTKCAYERIPFDM